MKWMYNLNDAEAWTSDEFDTKEEAIAAAKEEIALIEKLEGIPHGDIFRIGQVELYNPMINVDFISQLEEQAYDECGEVAEGWLEDVDEKQKQTLDSQIQEVITKWLEDIGKTPGFGSIENIERIKR
ncbi:hypothetical protein [Bacillus cereus]|uniref:hypothetical protein n=1 Tax=Bacillus cereus TaxID=1396 RepID=UPI00211D894A|nr:hypothetical protein [Bacillus cereus]